MPKHRKLNYEIKNNLVYLIFKKGTSILDLNVFNKIEANYNKISYHMDKLGYVNVSYYNPDKVRIRTGLHRLIMDCPRDKVIDHIDRNPKNNQVINLRITDQTTNNFNTREKWKHNTSGIKGVSYRKSRKKWRAYIQINYKHIDLGEYKTKEEAVLARKQGEIDYGI